MDLETVIPSEVSRTEKEKYHMTCLICGILKRNDTDVLTYGTERDLQTEKTNL